MICLHSYIKLVLPPGSFFSWRETLHLYHISLQLPLSIELFIVKHCQILNIVYYNLHKFLHSWKLLPLWHIFLKLDSEMLLIFFLPLVFSLKSTAGSFYIPGPMNIIVFQTSFVSVFLKVYIFFVNLPRSMVSYTIIVLKTPNCVSLALTKLSISQKELTFPRLICFISVKYVSVLPEVQPNLTCTHSILLFLIHIPQQILPALLSKVNTISKLS